MFRRNFLLSNLLFWGFKMENFCQQVLKPLGYVLTGEFYLYHISYQREGYFRTDWPTRSVNKYILFLAVWFSAKIDTKLFAIVTNNNFDKATQVILFA